NAYLAAGEQFPAGMWEQEVEALKATEKATGKKFGDSNNPLLVSCRSGAKFSMPGMMDTVLNIGLNDEVVEGVARLTGDARFAYDSYRRLIQMFGSVVMGVDDEHFEEVLAEAREKAGVKTDAELNAEQWKEVTAKFEEIFKQDTGQEFPQDPIEQIKLATEAVFKSWNGKRAIDYRNAAGIAHDLGTAVNIVTMVFGNMGDTSGTGVAFTRDPATGENVLYGDYLINAQGEDVVAGTRNTEPIANMEQDLPEANAVFVDICAKLEDHYHEMQDLEFTIEQGKLWMLQTRDGKRTAKAAIKIAVDMANEGRITKEQAVLRVSPDDVDTLLHPQFDMDAKDAATAEGKLLAKGVNASPGAAVGVVAFDADLAEKWGKEEGKDVIMVRPFTRPDDVHGMLASKGILTSEGGATSHAAVVARQFGVPCVVGASDVAIDQ
ncbi:MAG: pyruvate, phosphate dikinase, partial [Chloroflexi bacterium]|nr:pyruvate, phosphate dikinase [Chloroflexota bacterium]